MKTFILITFLLFLLIHSSYGAAEIQINEKVPSKILLLNSYDQEMNWVKGITRGVLDTLQAEPNNLTVHIENMDTKMFFSNEYYTAFSEYLKVKYSETSFSVILVSDNNAYDFMRARRDLLFHGVPVIFCGVNNFEHKQLTGLKNFTGVEEVVTVTETAELILRLHPETTDIFVINDFLKTGRAWDSNIKKSLNNFSDKIKIRYSKNSSLQDLQEEISNLSHTTVVMLGVYFSDRDGLSSTYEEMGEQLAKISKVPVYCLAEFNISRNVIGGMVMSGYAEGQAMAELGKNIIEGTNPNSITVSSTGSNRWIFNHTQLNKFQIDESLLPDGSIIKYRPFSLYLEYKSQAWMILCFIGVLLLTILFLVINIKKRRQTEVTLQENEKRFRLLYQQAPVMLCNVDMEGSITQVNNLWLETLEYTPKEVLGVNFHSFLSPTFMKQEGENFSTLILTDSVNDIPCQFVHKDGRLTDVLLNVDIEKDIEGKLKGARIGMVDVSEHIRVQAEKEKLELQLFQAQKIESIGRLAGGVAHDINNLLSPILGYTEMLGLDPDLSKKNRKKLEQITKAGCGVRDLVKQLLAFSRKQTLEVVAININETLEGYRKLLKHTIRENIIIKMNLSVPIKPILADRGQIEQVIMNLVVNAADSMTNGGDLIIKTSMIQLDTHFCSTHQDAVPGEYVMMSVSDTGCGIAPETAENIFEPFFSTKGELGTGLGLSTVYGITRQHDGCILVYSEPGIGSTFKVYLPISDKATVKKNIEPTSNPQLMGTENILLVEDNEQVRELTQAILEQLGYNIYPAKNGAEALTLAKAHAQTIQLLLTDVIMPGMNGKELYTQMSTTLPNLKVLYMSGYADDIIAKHGAIDERILFIEKPFTTQLLAEKVREALGFFIPIL